MPKPKTHFMASDIAPDRPSCAVRQGTFVVTQNASEVTCQACLNRRDVFAWETYYKQKMQETKQ